MRTFQSTSEDRLHVVEASGSDLFDAVEEHRCRRPLATLGAHLEVLVDDRDVDFTDEQRLDHVDPVIAYFPTGVDAAEADETGVVGFSDLVDEIRVVQGLRPERPGTDNPGFVQVANR